MPASILGMLVILIIIPVLVKKLEFVGRSENPNWECYEDRRRKKAVPIQGTGNMFLSEATTAELLLEILHQRGGAGPAQK